MRALRLVRRLVSVLLSFFAATTGAVHAQTLVPPQIAIPLANFGMHFHRLDNRGTTWPSAGCAVAPAIRIGSVRLWDAEVTWRDLQPQPGVWN